MFRLIIRRLALGLLTLVLVSGIVFVAVEALPGDACTSYLGRMAQGKRLENCRRDFGLERPALTRYVEWTAAAVQGDLGISLKRNKPTSGIIGPRLRNTLVLGLAATMIGVPIAVLLGIIAGLWRDRPVDLWAGSSSRSGAVTTTPSAAQRPGLETAGPGNHRPNGPEANDALTIKLDHSMGADQIIIDHSLRERQSRW